MSQFLLITLFSVSLCLVLLTYLVYPVLLLLAQIVSKSPQTGSHTPRLSLIVSAYNEQAVISRKLENALVLDYPKGQMDIVVISDESTDSTDRIVRSYADRGVVLHRQEPRRGKSAGLTRYVPQAKGEILVFSDANSMYEPDAIQKLVRHFGDEKVGFVAGHQRYHDDDNAAATSESLYWRYETAVKTLESRVGSVVCGDGAIYAIRAELFEPLAADDINDFTLPLKIIIRGYRGVFDPEAVCYEHAAEDFSGEFRRRVRIVNRSFRAVCRNWRALSPFHVGLFSLQLFVHKVIRWFVPFLLAIVLATNAVLVAMGSGWFWTLFLGLQLLCYLMAAAYAIPGCRSLKPVYICFYFCVANVAAGLGILTFLAGKRFETWTPERGQNSEKHDNAEVDSPTFVPVASTQQLP